MRKNMAFVHLLFLKQIKTNTVLAFGSQCLITLSGSIIEYYSSFRVIITGDAKRTYNHFQKYLSTYPGIEN